MEYSIPLTSLLILFVPMPFLMLFAYVSLFRLFQRERQLLADPTLAATLKEGDA